MATLAEVRTAFAGALSAAHPDIELAPAPPLLDATPGVGVVYIGRSQPGPRFGGHYRATLLAAIVTGSEHDEAAAEDHASAWTGPLLAAALGGLPDPNPLAEYGPGAVTVEPTTLDLTVDGRPLFALVVSATFDVEF